MGMCSCRRWSSRGLVGQVDCHQIPGCLSTSSGTVRAQEGMVTWMRDITPWLYLELYAHTKNT